MLAKTQIGVEEYLGLAPPDRLEPDYLDGEVVERSLPTIVHALIQGQLILLFAPLLTRFRLFLLPELRVQIDSCRFRVADLAVYRDLRPEGRYATDPAFLIIEIVSPDDRYSEITQRLEDYRGWGVPHVWLADPQLKRLYEYTEAGLLQQSNTAKDTGSTSTGVIETQGARRFSRGGDSGRIQQFRALPHQRAQPFLHHRFSTTCR